ncbi:MAG: tetratricopeptide repeat protein [Polyangia bacterium]
MASPTDPFFPSPGAELEADAEDSEVPGSAPRRDATGASRVSGAASPGGRPGRSARAPSQALVPAGEQALSERPEDRLSRVVSTALAETPRTLPKLEMARSLEEAGPRALVYVDEKGRVQPPTRYRVALASRYAALSAVVLGGSMLYGQMFGPLWGIGLLLSLSALIAGLLSREMFATRLLNQAVALCAHDRCDEAEVLLRRLLSRRKLPQRHRALGLHNLAVVASRRGEHLEALAYQRAAMRIYQQAWPQSPHYVACQYGEVMTLCNLGRLDEAAEHLRALPERPDGDYLLLKSWTADLYLRFCRGDGPPDAEALWERAERALKITSAVALLGLCSWAYTQGTGASRDLDMAWHLLREAHGRLVESLEESPDNPSLARLLPPLWKWMVEHRAEAAKASEP